MTGKRARFLLTRRAASDLRSIHAYSSRKWGPAVAQKYMADLYAAMHQVADDPHLGTARLARATPFRMAPAREHFLIFDVIPRGVVVLTVQHQVRDIESLVAQFRPSFLAQVAQLRQAN